MRAILLKLSHTYTDLSNVAHTTEWRYTSANEEIAYSLSIYSPIALSYDEIKEQIDGGNVTLTMPMDTEPITMFKQFNPAGVIKAELFLYRSESDVTRIFTGKILGVNFKVDEATAEVKLGSFQSLLNGSIPVETYGPTCPFRLFSTDCGVDSTNSSYYLDLYYSALTIDGNKITSAYFDNYDDGFFTFGYVQVDNRISTITNHVGADIWIQYSLGTGLSGTDVCRFYAGCDWTYDTCKNRFSNQANFRGFPLIPDRNPFIDGWK